MAFNKIALKNSIKQGLIQILSNPNIENNVNQIADQMAELFSDKIDVYVKTGNAVGSDSNGDTHTLNLE